MSAERSVSGGDDRPMPAGVAEATLMLLTIVAAASFGRLFTDGAYLPPVMVAAVIAHLLAATLRRRRVPGGPRILILLPAGAWLALALALDSSLTAWVPTPSTFDAVGSALSEAASVFAAEAAPVPVIPGFVLLSVVGVFVASVLADWAAFDLRARFESTIPALTLFVFSTVLGSGRHQLLSAVATLGALMLFMAAHHLQESERATWLARPRRGRRALTQRTALTGVLVVVAAAAIGPNLPGADADALVSWREGDGFGSGSNRVTVSPLVDIRGRIVQQSDLEVFTVAADQRAYWRLTALDTFDGNIWSSLGSFGDARGGLDTVTPPAVESDEIRQQFTIEALASIWLPAAFEPTTISGVDGARHDRESGSLITEADTGDGLVYQVTSARPTHDPDDLRANAVRSSPDPRFTDLPPDFPPSVRDLAVDVMGPVDRVYEAARALQDWFRSEFTYDLSVAAGHSEGSISSFLFDTRRGYCEQFAGTFAAMARSVGIPARVAVGFTPGELGDDGLYHVRGEHAHAWPEVWIDGAGWIAFEPTPGRGAPGAEAVTGVPEQQAVTGDASSATTVPAPPPDSGEPDGGGSTATSVPADGASGTGGDAADGGTATDWLTRIAGGAAVLLVATVGLAAMAVTMRARRRVERRRRAFTEGSDAVVAIAWSEAVDAARRGGALVDPALPLDAQADHLARHGRVDRASIIALATLVEGAAYAASEPEPDDAEAAVALAGQVTDSARTTMGLAQRARWALDVPVSPVSPVGGQSLSSRWNR